VQQILEPSIVLWSSVHLPNCGSLLGHEEDNKETEKEDGKSVGGVKLHGGGVQAALAAPSIFV